MARKKKPKLPSRVRYEAAHPVITVRVSQALYDTYREQVEASGESGAGWFKARLTQDQVGIERQRRAAALQRDSLGEELRELRRQRDSLRAEIEAQRKQVVAGVEEERKRLLEEARRGAEVEACRTLASYAAELHDAEEELAATLEELEAKRAEVFKLDMDISRKRPVIESYMRQAIEEVQKQGVPAMQCLQCPAHQFYQGTIGRMLAAVTAAKPAVSPSPQQGQQSEPATPAASAPPEPGQGPLQGPRVD